MDMHSLLVATDFSECEAYAFRMAEKLARAWGQDTCCTSHAKTGGANGRPPAGGGGQPEDRFRERAQHQMGEFLRQVNTGILEVESMVAIGVPFREITVVPGTS